ncbi:ABC transporter permease [Leifsonia shinshuensis]|uniref:ABC transporter permease n=1 Tax=Leifsonia shinshuensis TaxID=150026 RepID=UPI002865DFC7|nr:ABC transporter permease [Leifsonia shinshuensis]MDR6972873.1 peptide/nickel transport system permease protein [Leifsonia shinshuensis]
MLWYLFQRLLALLPTVLVPLILVFLLIRLAPGDPASIILGDQATAAQVASLRQQMGLDEPLIVQFGHFLGDIVTLNLGTSSFLQRPVLSVLPGYAAVTLELSALALVWALVFGIVLGAIAAFRRRRFAGRAATNLGILGISLPNYFIALVLIIVFAVSLRWFPVGGYVPASGGFGPHLQSLILPSLALGLAEVGFVSRITRGSLLDVIGEPFVVTARSLGVRQARITGIHVSRLAALPVLTVVGLLAASLISGSVVVENIFGIPGIGQLMFNAVSNRDYNLIQGIVLFSGITIILVNLVIDILYAVVDPRVQYGAKSQ